MSIQIKVRSTFKTVTGDTEIEHQRHRTRHIHQVSRQLNIPTIPTPAFSQVLCFHCMCCVEKVNKLINHQTWVFLTPELVMQHSGWVVHQRSFVAGARSLHEEEFKENLEYFKVPSTSIDSIRTKLVMTIFDEYANILKGMYSIRFNGRPDSGGTSVRPDTGRPDRDLIPPLINSLTTW